MLYASYLEGWKTLDPRPLEPRMTVTRHPSPVVRGRRAGTRHYGRNEA